MDRVDRARLEGRGAGVNRWSTMAKGGRSTGAGREEGVLWRWRKRQLRTYFLLRVGIVAGAFEKPGTSDRTDPELRGGLLFHPLLWRSTTWLRPSIVRANDQGGERKRRRFIGFRYGLAMGEGLVGNDKCREW